jgi:magnesium-transporting ATPase (P-type)
MLYSATLLAPVPFDALRISVIGLLAAVSCALAYFSSSLFRNPADTKRLRLIQIIAKPPFVVWIVAVVIISFQLANGLYMLYLVNRK